MQRPTSVCESEWNHTHNGCGSCTYNRHDKGKTFGHWYACNTSNVEWKHTGRQSYHWFVVYVCRTDSSWNCSSHQTDQTTTCTDQIHGRQRSHLPSHYARQRLGMYFSFRLHHRQSLCCHAGQRRSFVRPHIRTRPRPFLGAHAVPGHHHVPRTGHVQKVSVRPRRVQQRFHRHGPHHLLF